MNHYRYTLFVLLTILLAWAPPARATEQIVGIVVEVEKDHLLIEEEETGENLEIHYDDRTRVDGNLEEGVIVEMVVQNGHAVSIQVLDETDGFDDELRHF